MSVRELHRRAAVVAGGASGIGLSLGTLCAGRGMNVALLDRDGRRAEAAASALQLRYGVEAFGVAVDTASGTAVQHTADTVAACFGRADLVFAGAGVRPPGSGVEQQTDDEWHRLLDVNVVGAARTARAFLPLLRMSPGGCLVFTASALALAPTVGMAAFQAGEFAVWGLAESLRLELRDEGIGVSVLFPAETSAGRHDSGPVRPERTYRLTPVRDPFEPPEPAHHHAHGPTHDQTPPDTPAPDVLDAVMAGERYIVTQGDLFDAVVERSDDLLQATLDADTRHRAAHKPDQTHHAS